MRVVVVSMVKNEADVIEAFCRHVAAFADHHLVFDHASTDGTKFILRRLSDEGLSLSLFRDDRPEKRQDVRTTALMARAVRDFGADWVVPLDADEFPQPGSAGHFRDALKAADPRRPFWVWMRDYAPHDADEGNEANPVLRMRHHVGEARRSAGKVIVPQACAGLPHARLTHGNHGIEVEGKAVEAVIRDDLWLAHYPARTGAQVAVKVLTGEWQRLAHAAPDGIDSHYRAHALRFAADPGPFLASAGHYLRGTVEDPAAYWGGTLRYPPLLGPGERALASLLPYVDDLARSHGRLLAASRTAPARFGPRAMLARLRRWFRPHEERPAGDGLIEGVILPDSVTSDAVAGQVELVRAIRTRDGLHLTVRARNVAPTVWRCDAPGGTGCVNLSSAFVAGGEPVLPLFTRHRVPHDVLPGDAVEWAVTVPVPPDPNAELYFGLEREGDRWFGPEGIRVRPTDVPFAVARAA
jgi:hypothetical protein